MKESCPDPPPRLQRSEWPNHSCKIVKMWTNIIKDQVLNIWRLRNRQAPGWKPRRQDHPPAPSDPITACRDRPAGHSRKQTSCTSNSNKRAWSQNNVCPRARKSQRPMALITVSTGGLRKAIAVKIFSHALHSVAWKLLTHSFISALGISACNYMSTV